MRPDASSPIVEAVATPFAPHDGPGVVLEDIPWPLYLRLRDVDSNIHVRMTYLDETLILVSPEYAHGTGAELLATIVRETCDALGLDFASTRTTTFRHDGAAKEPDAGYYLGANERRIRNKPTIDLEIDPPPDLAIEVENTRDSALALSIYARLGVPEVWRYDGRRRALWFGRLEEGAYASIDRSLGLPVLTPPLVSEALDVYLGGDVSEREWIQWVRAWARALPPPP